MPQERRRAARMAGETKRSRRGGQHVDDVPPEVPRQVATRFPPVTGHDSRGEVVTADIVPMLGFLHARGVSLTAVANAIDDAVDASRWLHFSRRQLSAGERAERESLRRLLVDITQERKARAAAGVGTPQVSTLKLTAEDLGFREPFRSVEEARSKLGAEIVARLTRTGAEIAVDAGLARDLGPFDGYEVVAGETEAHRIAAALGKVPAVVVASQFRHAAAALLKAAPHLGAAVAGVESGLPVRLAQGRPRDHFGPSSRLAKTLRRLRVMPREREVFLLYASRRAMTAP